MRKFPWFIGETFTVNGNCLRQVWTSCPVFLVLWCNILAGIIQNNLYTYNVFSPLISHFPSLLVNTTNTSVYNMFIARHIYFHLLQSSRVNRNTRLQEFQDQCFAISLVTRTFCERSVEEFDSVKHSHFHIEMYCNFEVVLTFSSRKKGEVSTC